MQPYVVGYLHLKGLKIQFNDKTPVEKRKSASYEIRKPGEAVPEAEIWKPSVLQAHLNLRMLQTQAEFDAMAEQYAKGLKGKKAAEPKVTEPKAQMPKADKKVSKKKKAPVGVEMTG